MNEHMPIEEENFVVEDVPVSKPCDHMEEKLFAALSEIQELKKKRTIAFGEITAVETKKNIMKVFLVVLYKGLVKIRIPFEEMYRENPIDPESVKEEGEEFKRQIQMAQKCIGAHISFAINHYQQGKELTDYAVMASRRSALLALEDYYYKKRDRTGRLRTTEGLTINAEILSVGANAVMLTVNGVDTRVEKWSLSYIPLGDLRDGVEIEKGVMLKPGHVLPVVITKIQTNAQGRIEVFVSHKALEKARASVSPFHLSRGTICLGNISGVRRSVMKKEVEVQLWLSNYNVPAIATYVPSAVLYQADGIGTEVRVKIIEQIEDGKNKGLYRCRIMSIGPASPYAAR